MKNTILLILIFLTLINVNGQSHLLGIRGGINWTEAMTQNFVNDRNYRRSFIAGFSYDYLLKKHFSIGADFMYNQRGFRTEMIFRDDLGNPTGKKAIFKHNYDYISIPIKLGYNYGSKIYGFTNISLVPSLLIDAKTITPSIEYNGTLIEGEVIKVTNRVNKFDIGGIAEVGSGYKFGNIIWLYTSFLYQHSFTTITNSNYFANSRIRHYGMAINLGVKYLLVKK